MTVRLPVSLERLQQKMLVRKMAQRKPASQQEIVQEAIRRWLDQESSNEARHGSTASHSQPLLWMSTKNLRF